MSRETEPLTELLEKYVKDAEIAGASLLVRKNGDIAYEAHHGFANLETRSPVTEHSIFRLASMTKPVAAIAAMMLGEQGRLSLDDSIADFLPEYEGKSAVKILHLLNHSSGLAQEPGGLEEAVKRIDPQDKLADRVRRWADIALDFPPGTGTGYSPLVAFDILGRIIEIVSDCDLQTYFRQRIFEPLGIRDMAFTLTPVQMTRLVRLYEADGGALRDVSDTDPLWPMVNAMTNGYFSAAGGLYGTLRDYDKIVRLLAGNGTFGGVRLLREESVRRMRTVSTRHGKEPAPGLGWGLGMAVHQAPDRFGVPLSVGTYGWSGAYGTHFFIDERKNIQAVLMLNRSNIGGFDSYISREVEKRIYGK